MANSQNGWTAIASYGDGRLKKLDWITGTVLEGDVHYLFNHLSKWFNSNIEVINKGSSWGYAPRPIRGSNVISNHASGTAIDLNASKHPLGKANTFSFTKQVQIRNQMKNVYGGVIRWGGDYSGRKDDMHFEINASTVRVSALVKKLKAESGSLNGGVTPQAPSKPVVKPPVSAPVSVYTVIKGDNLSTIAVRFKTTVKELQALNGIKNANEIKIGQKLKVKENVTISKPSSPVVSDKIVLKTGWNTYGNSIDAKNTKNKTGYILKAGTYKITNRSNGSLHLKTINNTGGWWINGSAGN